MRYLDKAALSQFEDWYGNNAAVQCTACDKVFIVSAVLHRKGRSCPVCGKSTATVTKQQVSITEPSDTSA
jgi:rRNA maturation endonuclease Nob1